MNYDKEELTEKRKNILSRGDYFPEAFRELDLLEMAAAELHKTQQALRESEEKYRMLFTNVPLAIVHFNSDRKIIGYNNNFSMLADIQPEQLNEAHLLDVLDFHMVSAIENSLEGSIGHYEGDYQTKHSKIITPVRVNFAPIKLEDGKIIGGVGIFEDISERKQIERIFFHDILNTAGSMNSVIDLIESDTLDQNEKKDLMLVLSNLAKRIIGEITTHRHLVTSEGSNIKTNIVKLDSLSVITRLLDSFNHSDILQNKLLRIDTSSTDDEFESDETLVGRVLGNMIKNAIEASKEGETIYLKSYSNDEFVCFEVKNSSFIPVDIQHQLFNKSISTKGAGRGLGMYSMKLLTEKYLGGKVSFSSQPENGTIFTASYPKKHLAID